MYSTIYIYICIIWHISSQCSIYYHLYRKSINREINNSSLSSTAMLTNRLFIYTNACAPATRECDIVREFMCLDIELHVQKFIIEVGRGGGGE